MILWVYGLALAADSRQEIKRAVQEFNTKVACLFDLHQQVQKNLATLRKERNEQDEIPKATCCNGADQIKTDKKTAAANQTTTKQNKYKSTSS